MGFAAETGSPGRSVLDLGRQKLQSKGADLLVVNEVGESAGFEVAHNAAVVLGADGSVDGGAGDDEGPAGAPGLGPDRGAVAGRLRPPESSG